MGLPTMRVEGRCFAEGCSAVAGVDEVGRGAWAGPVSVGVVVVTPGSGRRIPKGVRDSKQLTFAEREALFEPLARSVASWAVGHASNEECDELGMTAAQRLAARRAFDQLDVAPDLVLLDGKFDFLHHEPPELAQQSLFETPLAAHTRRSGREVGTDFPPARMIVKGDDSVKAIAAASVLAKVTRDRVMAEESEHYPWYAFDRNRGYPAPHHKMALATWGCTPFHRHSWAFMDGLLWRPALPDLSNGWGIDG
ncbi:MAG: ribonuclease HII [Acidimicrobiales bacterium]